MENEQMAPRVCSFEYINEDVDISKVGENDMPFWTRPMPLARLIKGYVETAMGWSPWWHGLHDIKCWVGFDFWRNKLSQNK